MADAGRESRSGDHRRPALPLRLRDSRKFRMSSKQISCEHGCERALSVVHGLGAWLSIVAIPTSEPCGDPAEKAERVRWVRVLLLLGSAFEFARQTLQSHRKLSSMTSVIGRSLPSLASTNWMVR